MNRSQVKVGEILGHYRPCVFSRVGNGEHPFKYEPCRSECDGYNTTCPAYIPSHSPGKTILSKATLVSFSSQDIIKRNEEQIKKNDKILRPFYWYHSVVEPMNPKLNIGLIRKANDSTSY